MDRIDYYSPEKDMLYCSKDCAKQARANLRTLREIKSEAEWEKLSYEHPNHDGNGPHFGVSCNVCEGFFWNAGV